VEDAASHQAKHGFEEKGRQIASRVDDEVNKIGFT